METNQLVRLHAVPHPSAPVRRAGFPLDHPYLEQCWAPVIGPTSVLLLRRLPVLWRENVSIELELEELAGSLGLGHSTGRNAACNAPWIGLSVPVRGGRGARGPRRVHRGAARPCPPARPAAGVVPDPARAAPGRSSRRTGGASRRPGEPDQSRRPPRPPQPTCPDGPTRPEPAPMTLTARSPAALTAASPSHARPATNVVATRPSSKHTLAGFPPGNLRCSRSARESRS